MPGTTGYALVLDGNGVPLWYYPATAKEEPVDVDNVVPGAISCFISFPSSQPFQIHQLAPLATTDVGANSDAHELRVANGDFLVRRSRFRRV